MDAGSRARTLVSTTKKGNEGEVPCAQLDEGVGRALLDLGEQARTRSFEPAAVAFRLAERAGRCASSDALIGAALNALSDTLIGVGNFDEAFTTARESIDVHTRLHDDVGLAEAWNRVGNAEGWRDHIQPALEAYQRALDISTAAGDRLGQARAWNNLSNVHRMFGELDTALDYLTKAQRVFEELGDWSRAAVVTNNIGLVDFNRGDTARRSRSTRGRRSSTGRWATPRGWPPATIPRATSIGHSETTDAPSSRFSRHWRSARRTGTASASWRPPTTSGSSISPRATISSPSMRSGTVCVSIESWATGDSTARRCATSAPRHGA